MAVILILIPPLHASQGIEGPEEGERVTGRGEGRPSNIRKSPSLAAILSSLFPGLGHLYLDDAKTAGRFFLTSSMELLAMGVTWFDNWPEGTILDPYGDPTFLLSSILFQNTSLYSIFAAYRDARLSIDDEGYRYPVAEERLKDLLIAPFDYKTLIGPDVAIGGVSILAFGLLASYMMEGDLRGGGDPLYEREKVNFMGRYLSPWEGAALGEIYYMGLFMPVAIGEEAFFRGTIQSGLSESYGEWPGWVISSLIFGLLHISNIFFIEDYDERVRYLTIGIPSVTLIGSYLGWVYRQNNFSLKGSVALHFWYDFLISTIFFILNPDEQPFAVGFNIPF